MDVNTILTIISLISGAVGGNLTGSGLLSDKNLGAIGSTIAGLVGGGAGEFILKLLGVLGAGAATGTAAATGATPGPEALDISSLLASIGAGGVGGGVLTAIVAYIKEALMKK